MVLVGTCTFYGCKKEKPIEEVNLTGLGGDKWAKTDNDTWIYENLTKPYNIEVKYKWDGTEVDMGYILVPPYEDKVIPVLKATKIGWINPYENVAGGNFIKQYCQKSIVLLGTGEWLSNGTKIIGAAEGGRKVSIMEVNKFSKSNSQIVHEMLHTIHHEFGHILNQNIPVTVDYERITPAGYTATWFNYSDDDSREMGFITAYARASKDEDFVEMLSMMLTLGKGGYENALSNIHSADAVAQIRKKEAIVRAYLQSSFGIDFDALQVAVQNGITTILN